MRHAFPNQPGLLTIPIEKIHLPLTSRDQLPPLLAGRQWLWTHPTLKTELLALLAAQICAGKKAAGRPGMDRWQILVCGGVRRCLAADWDRLEHLANYDARVRQMLGLPLTPWGQPAKGFGHQTLRDNVARLDHELLSASNARISAAGRAVFAPHPAAALAPLAIKVDTYVLETDVPFPTDLNLLWDAGRKCLDLLAQYRDQFGYTLPGWRQAKAWRRQLKSSERTVSQILKRGGTNKEARVKSAVRASLATGRELSAKVQTSLLELCAQPVATAHWDHLAYVHGRLNKHLALVDRRLLPEETIPAAEKVFSLFEPHTEWISKGKTRPAVELGHRLLIATCQHQLIHDYDAPMGVAEVDLSIPVTDRLLGRYGPGSLASLSFDKGFSRNADRELLSLYVPEVVMPQRGNKNAAETQREHEQKFVALRRAHRAVESAINRLEPHGLNRGPDAGRAGYQRYVGYGVMSYNLHVIGRELLARARATAEKERAPKPLRVAA